jgi:hypothetical protein
MQKCSLRNMIANYSGSDIYEIRETSNCNNNTTYFKETKNAFAITTTLTT